uniref:Uncharacterized protein n=1 Tax=Coturnix japonica TaxID=93934 RepID=A0A8C2YGV1_COTJA
MTRVATRMSAEARDTRKRFWGALSARLVKTAMMTRTLPKTVKSLATPCPSLPAARALCHTHTHSLTALPFHTHCCAADVHFALYLTALPSAELCSGVCTASAVSCASLSYLNKWVWMELQGQHPAAGCAEQHAEHHQP